MTRSLLLICFLFCNLIAWSQKGHEELKSEWAKQEFITMGKRGGSQLIRIGDIDNFGYGWASSRKDLCNNQLHTFKATKPKPGSKNDGFDCILLSPKYSSLSKLPCGRDKNARNYDPRMSLPVPYRIPLQSLNSTIIQNATLQIFASGLEAQQFCSVYQMKLNGVRFPEGEKMLNSLSMDGSFGEMINIPIKHDYFEQLSNGKALTVTIEEVSGSGDSYMIDFMQLLVNASEQNGCISSIGAYVYEGPDSKPVPDAIVTISDLFYTQTDSNGYFHFENVMPGYTEITASKGGYNDATMIYKTDGEPTDGNNFSLTTSARGIYIKGNQVMAGTSYVLDEKKLQFKGAGVIPEIPTGKLDILMTEMVNNPSIEVELRAYVFNPYEEQMPTQVSSAIKMAIACKNYLTRGTVSKERVTIYGISNKSLVLQDNKSNRIEVRLRKIR